jgi:hypothetical protein
LPFLLGDNMIRKLSVLAALLLCSAGLFPLPIARAQVPQDGAPQSAAAPAEPSPPPLIALPTYTDPRFGLSFEIPNNYSLMQGQGAGARPGDFGMVPEDYGEYIFAKIERTGSPPFPIFAPSPAALYFGIHLGISPEDCLAPLDFLLYDSKGTTLIDGITFHWSADLRRFSAPSGGPIRPGGGTFRDYAGYANSVCYEFHLRTQPSSGESSLTTLEDVLATVKFLPRTRAVPFEPGQLETPFPVTPEVPDLARLASWRITYPKIGASVARLVSPFPGAAASNQAPVPIRPRLFPANVYFNAITLTYQSDESDDEAATADIAKLEENVIDLLNQYDWRDATRSPGENCSRTYRKGKAAVEMNTGTSRCTALSPCTQFDMLTLTIYLPAI